MNGKLGYTLLLVAIQLCGISTCLKRNHPTLILSNDFHPLLSKLTLVGKLDGFLIKRKTPIDLEDRSSFVHLNSRFLDFPILEREISKNSFGFCANCKLG